MKPLIYNEQVQEPMSTFHKICTPTFFLHQLSLPFPFPPFFPCQLVAAIGDSLTAGNGALAKTAFGLLIQYRGRSFSMGGDGSGRGWEDDDVITFPNLLRHFSKHLQGDSIYKGAHDSKYAR